MNKETIYIGTNDDITDVLTKFKASDKSLVVLVAPKNPSVLLSSVNLKLLARSSRSLKRALVLVSPDEKLKKLALDNGLPIAASLKSRPVMPEKPAFQASAPAKTAESKKSEPKSEPVQPTSSTADFVSEPQPFNTDQAPEKTEASPTEDEDNAPLDEISLDDENTQTTHSRERKNANPSSDAPSKDEDTEEKPKKSKKSKSKKQKIIKWVIFGVSATAVLALFLVWALIFAPKAEVAVNVKTSSSNFSESITFSTAPADENAKEGTLYAHEEKLEKDQTIKFSATGQKDVGEKATGTLTIYIQTHDNKYPGLEIPAGTVFSYGGLDYVSQAVAKLSEWKGDDKKCDPGSSITNGCIISTQVSVKAAAPGEKYNLSADQHGWTNKDFGSISVSNSTAISGGTSKIVTVVQQGDVVLALEKLTSESKEEGKSELLSKLSSTVMPLSASFKVETSEPKVSPAAGEEVPEGVTPQVSSKTTYSILTADLARVEDFIKAKTELPENTKIYSIGEPFVEQFAESGEGKYSAKLKTTLKTGPQISETEVLDKISGQKIGRVEPILKDTFPGITNVEVNKSFFWVSSVPKNPNKVKIDLQIED